MHNRILMVLAGLTVLLSAESHAEAAGDTHPSSPAELVSSYVAALQWRTNVALDGTAVTRNIGFNDSGFNTIKFRYRRNNDLAEWKSDDTILSADSKNTVLRADKFAHIFGADFYADLWQEKPTISPDASVYMAPNANPRLVETRKRQTESLEYGGFMAGYLQGTSHNDLPALLQKAENLEELPGEHLLRNIACRVIKAHTQFGDIELWLSPEYGYNALKCVLTRNSSQYYDQKTLAEIGLSQWRAEMNVLSIKEFAGVYVPTQGEYRQTSTDTSGKQTGVNSDVEITSADIHPDFAALEAFTLTFPEGTMVTYAENPTVQYIVRDKAIVPYASPETIRAIEASVDSLGSSSAPVSPPTDAPQAEPGAASAASDEGSGGARHVIWFVVVLVVATLLGAGTLIWRCRKSPKSHVEE